MYSLTCDAEKICIYIYKSKANEIGCPQGVGENGVEEGRSGKGVVERGGSETFVLYKSDFWNHGNV